MAKQCATVVDNQGNIDSVILKNYDNITPLERAVERNKGYSMDKASNGEPSLLYQFYTDEMNMSPEEAEFVVANTFSTEFGDWFGRWWEDGTDASKVVDINGQPKPVWSGHEERLTTHNAYTNREEDDRISNDAFFPESKKLAQTFSTGGGVDFLNAPAQYVKYLVANSVEPVFLNIRNPRIVEHNKGTQITPLIQSGEAKANDGFYGDSSNQVGRGLKTWAIMDDSQVIYLDAISEITEGNVIMKAPNGNNSNLNEEQWKYVRTEEFKDFFGDWETDVENSSKIVDENGEPLIVYHGTNVKFDTFKGVKIQDKELSFFSTDLEYAQAHSMKNENSENSIIKEVFLNIRNPIKKSDINTLTIVKDIKADPSMKNDGFIGRDKVTDRNVIVTTNVDQIRSFSEVQTELDENIIEEEIIKKEENIQVQQNEFIPSQLFEELSQQPFMTKEQALDIYQHIYTEGLNEWKDNDMTC